MTQLDIEIDQPAVPDAVAKAVKLMLVGAALALVQMAVWIVINIHRPAVVAYNMGTGVVVAGVWWQVARTCRRGRSWGRVLASVFFGLATLGVLQEATGRIHIEAAIVVVNVLSWLVGLGVVVLLWRRDSGDYFRAAGAFRQDR